MDITHLTLMEILVYLPRDNGACEFRLTLTIGISSSFSLDIQNLTITHTYTNTSLQKKTDIIRVG